MRRSSVRLSCRLDRVTRSAAEILLFCSDTPRQVTLGRENWVSFTGEWYLPEHT